MTRRSDLTELRLSEPTEFMEYSYAREKQAWNEFHQQTTSLSRIEQFPTGRMWYDPVHGDVSLGDPLVVDLLDTRAMRRLWGVDQFGERWAVSSLLRTRPHNRGEHSLGTFVLIDQFAVENDPALRVAALLHDAGHTAFSHHGEAVFDATTAQNWHESHLGRILRDDRYEVAPVLWQHGIDPVEVEAYLGHPLLDRSLPDLCADRIDYLLRDGVAAGYLNTKVCHLIGDRLRVTEDGTEWYLADRWSADILDRLMTLLNLAQYTNPMMGEIKAGTVDLLSHALEQGYLSPADIAEGTDDSVLEKLWRIDASDPTLDAKLRDLMEAGLARSSIEAMGHVMDGYPEQFQVFDRQTKNRRINPVCEHEGERRRWSEWKAQGYDSWRDCPDDLPDVILPDPPYLTPEERQHFGITI